MEHFFEEICSMASLFKHESITFVIKEHPSCYHDHSKLHRKLIHAKVNVVFINDKPTEELIKHSFAVMTINSSVGMESLLFKKPVICLGEAIYGINGLTLPSISFEEAVKSLEKVIKGWVPDEKLRMNFLLYLYHVHLVKGSEGLPSDQHYANMAKKIGTIYNQCEQVH